jgi:hypothetical protein
MAYSTSNPPQLAVAGFGTAGKNLWTYVSDDASTSVDASGYITNGDALGMKVGDLVFHAADDGSVGHIYIVVSVTAGGAADLSDGQAIDATDSD